MAFLFKSKKRERVTIIFDIGSGSVGGAIVRMSDDNKKTPTILKSVRNEVVTRDEFDFNVILKDVLGALSATANELYNAKIGAPDDIVCVLASPWYLSETRVVKVTKDHSFIFTKKLADELLAKEVTALNASYQTKYGIIKSAPVMIEHNIMGVSLNGYTVDDPIGKRSKSVEMYMTISLSPRICLEKITKTLSNTFHHTPVSFSSFSICSYIAVRDRYTVSDSYLLLDIRGDITDVAIIAKGILKASLSFPFGKNTFYKYICTKLDIELRDAKELFNLYSTNTMTANKIKRVEPLFKSIENSWGEAFRACIGTLPHILTLPGTIFLTADIEIKDFFVNVIRSEPYLQSMVTEHRCNVVTLEGSEFLSMCSVKDNTCDPFLMIEAIGISRKRL